jgi:hypothetical protein
MASSDELRSISDPIWSNTYFVKNALGLYEGVSIHVEELRRYDHFFGLIQKFSSEYAVLGICRMFDKANRFYQKDTVYALFDYLKGNLSSQYIFRLKLEILTKMGIAAQNAQNLIAGLRDSFDTKRSEFLTCVESSMPKRDQNEPLERLFLCRDKMLAHQERLNYDLRERLEYLPSLASMEFINCWAENFVIMVISLLTPNVTLLPPSVSGRAAALNVAAKLLDMNFLPGSGEYPNF